MLSDVESSLNSDKDLVKKMTFSPVVLFNIDFLTQSLMKA